MGRTKADVEDEFPDDILSFQWFPDLPVTGEKRLCWATLYDAVYILLGPMPRNLAVQAEIIRQRPIDLVWINSDDMSYAYSFRSVCDVLGLSAKHIRSLICKAMAQDVHLPRRYWQSVGFSKES